VISWFQKSAFKCKLHRYKTVFDGKDVGSTVNIEIESQTQTIVDTIERVLAEKGL
jgi:riboflavin synthase alpha subunit